MSKDECLMKELRHEPLSVPDLSSFVRRHSLVTELRSVTSRAKLCFVSSSSHSRYLPPLDSQSHCDRQRWAASFAKRSFARCNTERSSVSRNRASPPLDVCHFAAPAFRFPAFRFSSYALPGGGFSRLVRVEARTLTRPATSTAR